MSHTFTRRPRIRPLLHQSTLVLVVAFALFGCGGGGSSDTTTTGDKPDVAEVIGCDEPAVLDKDGKVVFPAEATEIEGPVDVDEDLGLLSDLYPDLDTTTDAYHSSVKCEPSIGGTLPPEESPTDDQLAAEEYVSAFESDKGQKIVDDLKLNPLPPIAPIDTVTMGNCFMRTAGTDVQKQVPCDSKLFLQANQPFEGRDIIYVHGLATDHIKDKLLNPPSALGPVHPANLNWPADSGEFLNAGGYYRTYAENYWKAHILEHLGMGWQWSSGDPVPIYQPKANRYMLVAWSSNQTLEYAQHAMLTQIQLAISSNKNVVTPPTYPATFVRPFCSNGCIVISHSTGSPITSTAMSLAHAGFFGPEAQKIPNYIAAHISFAGAISGSRLASIAMAIGLSAAPAVGASNILCPINDWFFGTNNTCNADTTFLANTILRDLIPAVAQGVWGDFVDSSPVPTVTSAGGHPVGGYIATGFMLPGLDDGVVTMNSACGNPNPVFPILLPPSGLTVTSLVKGFDMTENGGKFLRAAKVLLGQKNLKAPAGPNYLAGTCTPYLSPTGMVMPVAIGWGGTPFDARNRFRNHYSFIQGLAEHSYDGGSSTANPWPSTGGNPPSTLRQYLFFGTNNLEESNAVTDSSIYSRMIDSNGTHLAKPVASHEIVRGRKVSFHMPFNIGSCKKKGTLNYFCQRWVWKRTYNLLDKWQEKQSSHYAYEFIGRR